MRKARICLALALIEPAAAAVARAQVTPPARKGATPAAAADTVRPIRRPATSLPLEAASAGITRFSFLAYGDTRGRRDGAEIQYEHALIVDAMLRTIGTMRGGPEAVRFVVQSGDAVVDGRDAKQWNVSFVPLINRLTTQGGVPYFLAPGNHDVGLAADSNPPAQPRLRNFYDATAQLIPPAGSPRRLAGYPTYAFGYGNTFVLAIDSNIADDATQYAWVKAQLEGLDRRRYRNLVVFFHHPVYSSGPHGGANIEPPTRALRTRYMPLFRRHRVRLLLAGHEHLFEHWVERYRDSSGAWRRMDEVVTGGGGAPIYAYQGEPDLREYERANAADSVRVEHLARPGPWPGDNPYHFVVVHVDGERLWLDVVGVDWGRGFAPYRSARMVLRDSGGAP